MVASTARSTLRLWTITVFISSCLSCPEQCFCNCSASVFHIDCHNNRISNHTNISNSIDEIIERFIENRSVTTLSINKASLTAIPDLVCQLSTLRTLNLDGNRLIRIPDNCLTNKKSLVKISAIGNRLTELQDGLFGGLQNLEELWFRDNRISTIGLRLFSNKSDLLKVRLIDLSENNLTNLEPWIIVRSLVAKQLNSTGIKINLSYNQISNFTNKLQLDYNYCSTKIALTELNLCHNNIQHITDLFRGWQIHDSVSIFCLIGKNKNNYNNLILQLGYNPFKCDCLDFKFVKIMRFAKHAGVPIFAHAYCSLSNLDLGATVGSTLDVLHYPLEKFTCDIRDHCPPRCSCIYRPANATMHINCCNTNLSSFPQRLLLLPKSYTKYKLDLSNNRALHRLEYREYFVNTSFIDVSHCGMKSVDERALNNITAMKYVNFYGNFLTEPPKLNASLIKSLRIDFGHNPWSCSCENEWIRTWFNSVRVDLVNPEGILCVTPSRLDGMNVFHVTDEGFCPSHLHDFTTDTQLNFTLFTGAAAVNNSRHSVIVASVVGAVLAIAILIICLVCRRRFRLFCRRRRPNGPNDNEDGNNNLMYDVFLSPSSKDNEVLGIQILEMLEAKDYRVCHHLRDFPAGGVIVDTISEAVKQSKRTVCLLTENFLHSDWCLEEFETSFHHHVIKRRRQSHLIVLMMLQNVFEVLRNPQIGTNSIRRYLRCYTYIDGRAGNWMDALCEVLPRPRPQQLQIAEEDDQHDQEARRRIFRPE